MKLDVRLNVPGRSAAQSL